MHINKLLCNEVPPCYFNTRMYPIQKCTYSGVAVPWYDYINLKVFLYMVQSKYNLEKSIIFINIFIDLHARMYVGKNNDSTAMKIFHICDVEKIK